MNMDTIKEIDVKSVMTKSSLPVGGYSVNPYVGCPPRLQVLLRIVHETVHRRAVLRRYGQRRKH